MLALSPIIRTTLFIAVSASALLPTYAKGAEYQLYMDFNDHSDLCIGDQDCIAEIPDLCSPFESVLGCVGVRGCMGAGRDRAALMSYAAVVAKCNPTLAYKLVLLAQVNLVARQSLIYAGQDLILAHLADLVRALQIESLQ